MSIPVRVVLAFAVVVLVGSDRAEAQDANPLHAECGTNQDEINVCLAKLCNCSSAVTTAAPTGSTIAQSATTADPSATTANPAVTTANSAATAADPAATTANPAVTTANPAATTANPSATTASNSAVTTVSLTTVAAATTRDPTCGTVNRADRCIPCTNAATDCFQGQKCCFMAGINRSCCSNQMPVPATAPPTSARDPSCGTVNRADRCIRCTNAATDCFSGQLCCFMPGINLSCCSNRVGGR